MFRQTLLIFSALLLAFASGSYKFVKTGEQLEETKYPENIETLATLKEFIKLVEEHNLNVSLIASSGKNHEDGNLEEAVAMTITFPVNEASIDKATLKEENFKKLVTVANTENITVGGSVATNNKLTVYSNFKKGLPITKAYKIFTGIKNGKTGFVFDEENYVAQYTFIVPGEDGKNHTTRVFHGDIDVEIVDKSANVKDDELTKIKKALIDTLFTYDTEVFPKALVHLLDHSLPDYSWEVAAEVGDHSYIDSNYWITFKVLDDNYLVFTS